MAISPTEAATDTIPAETPDSTVVAGPVSAWAAIRRTGGKWSLVHTSATLPIPQPATRPPITDSGTPYQASNRPLSPKKTRPIMRVPIDGEDHGHGGAPVELLGQRFDLGAVATTHRERPDDGPDHPHEGHRHREHEQLHGPVGGRGVGGQAEAERGERHRRDDRARVALEQVCAHPGDVTHVVAHRVGDGGGVAGGRPRGCRPRPCPPSRRPRRRPWCRCPRPPWRTGLWSWPPGRRR